MAQIAGHEFIDTPSGRRCSCGKTWMQILNEREYWKVGQAGIAHVGVLSQNEIDQLNREIDRIWRTLGG